MKIRFTVHAIQKFNILKKHGVSVSKQQVIRAIKEPDQLDHRRSPLLIAQIGLDERRVLRVVYRMEKDTIVIITFYPGRKSQYEKEI